VRQRLLRLRQDPRRAGALQRGVRYHEAMTKKEAVVQELIDAHFEVEPFLQEIWRIRSENEDSPLEPIKLLEVNVATVSTGSIKPFAFLPSQDVPYPTLIAEVTPEDFAAAQQDPRRLPEGWNLQAAERFARNGSR
jgi:hypothetical protein